MQKLFVFGSFKDVSQHFNTLEAEGGEVLICCRSNMIIENTEEKLQLLNFHNILHAKQINTYWEEWHCLPSTL